MSKYAGNGKEIQFSWGTMLKLTFSPDDLKVLNEQAQGNNGWVKLDVKQRREPSAKGFTHYGQVDEWKPPEDGQGAPQAQEADDEDVPF